MGGKSDDSSSRKMVQMQEQEAAEARAKETARQTRLDSGLASIKALFHGGNTYGTQTVGGSAGTAAVAPVTKKVWVEDPNTNHTGGGHWVTQTVKPGVAATGPTAGTEQQVVTGTSAGIGDEFYDKYKQGMLDYYTPQVAEKYGEATDQLTYNLARAGQGRSSVANDELAKLVKQNELRTAEVRSKADTATGDLKSRAADEEAKAAAQLYATENPEVAANQATAAIRDITAETPDLTPLGAIFDIASIGGANYLKGSQNAEYMKKIGALPTAGQSTTIV